MSEEISVDRLRRAIQRLPSDAPVDDPRVWYRTQREHWLSWLREYHGPGAYGRRPGLHRDARYAYNHIVNPQMLLWLAEACGVGREVVDAARRESLGIETMQGQSAAIRRLIPWEDVAGTLWPGQVGGG